MAGVIGAALSMSGVRSYYSTLAKPSFSPPGWVFGPAWTILFTLMGIAAWLVWKKADGNPVARVGLTLFIIQLVLNAAWSPLFFGQNLLLVAFIELVVLWIMIILTTIWFFKVSTLAGVLMLPYIAWVAFAGVLNYSIWSLNR